MKKDQRQRKYGMKIREIIEENVPELKDTYF